MAQQAGCFDSVSRVCTCPIQPFSLKVPNLPSTQGSVGFFSSKSNVAIIASVLTLVVAGILLLLVFVHRRHQRKKLGLLNNSPNSNFPDLGSSNVLPMEYDVAWTDQQD